MIVGILSDTHGAADMARLAVRSLLERGAGYLVHCGDVGGPDVLDALAGHPAMFVFGNNDYNRTELTQYAAMLGIACGGDHGKLAFAGKTAVVTHGDDFRLVDRLIREQKIDYLFLGHSHETLSRHEGRVHIINPGALYRAKVKTAAVLDTLRDSVEFVKIGQPSQDLPLADSCYHNEQMQGADDIPVTIRPFQPVDQSAAAQLYREGLLGDTKIADNDTGFDMDDVQTSYMKSPGSHFWVAVNEAGEVVGTIGVQHHEASTGEIRRLRVRPDSQRRGIGSKLMETALKFCHDHQYLKVTLDTYMDHEPAMRLFEKFRFRHSRSRVVAGKELRYFYLDLYAGEARK